MSSDAPEKLAIVAAAKYAMNDEERSVAKKAWLDGYETATDKYLEQIRHLEMELQQAKLLAMKLEAEK